jgi:hypothetical protein
MFSAVFKTVPAPNEISDRMTALGEGMASRL